MAHSLPVDMVTMMRVHSQSDKWLPVSIAPSDSDLEVCVIDNQGIHRLVFPCRKNRTEWVDASTKKRIYIQPTHWRKWTENRAERTDAARKAQQMSEAQFRGFLEESPDAVIVVDQTGRINFASNRIEAMFGHLSNELLGKPLSVIIPERYRDLHAGHLDRFMKHPSPRMMGAGLELRALRKDGTEFPVEISLSPHRTPDGLVVIAAIRDITVRSLKEYTLKAENSGLRGSLTQAGIDTARLLAQAGIDATENEAAKRLQRLLLEELHHRVKNTLATVIAITSQSLQTAETLEQGQLAVESRLIALGRAHDLLLQANWAGAKLTDVIRSALEPFDSHDVQRFVVQDTPIEVGPGAVLPLTMSLNELCTNAVKYGALSNNTGRIEIASTVDEKAQLFKLTWTEKGGPAVQEPTRRSFGTRLIGGLADQLHGDVRLRYEPAGVLYELDIPLAVLRALRAN